MIIFYGSISRGLRGFFLPTLFIITSGFSAPNERAQEIPPSKSWEGTYEYEEWVQQKGLKNKKSITYTLKIISAQNTLTGEFYINGQNIMEGAACKLLSKGDTLDVYFDRSLGDNFGNQLKKKNHLFSLVRSHLEPLSTIWSELPTPSGQSPEEGPYFAKLPANQVDTE